MIAQRAALFVDYENLVQASQARAKDFELPFGIPLSVNFVKFVDTLSERYGSIAKSDCIVAANFSHYDAQRGGLNQVATLIHTDSFEPRSVRSQVQMSPGKKYVIKNFADMQLAFEIGRHVTANPADMYLICTGDSAFAAIGRGIADLGIPVVFILPTAESGGQILKEEFPWISLENILESGHFETRMTFDSTGEPKGREKKDPVIRLLAVIGKFREELSVGVPVKLIEAFIGPKKGHKLIQRAQSEGRIDIWTSPDGVLCLSKREERLYGKMPSYASRPDLELKSQVLYLVAEIGFDGIDDPTQPGWRKAIKEAGGFTNKQAKSIVSILLSSKILQEGALQKPDIKFEKVLSFLAHALE